MAESIQDIDRQMISTEATEALLEVLLLMPAFEWVTEDDIWTAYWELTGSH